MTDGGDTGTPTQSPFTKPWFIVSGVVLVLAIIFGLIVFLVFPSTANKLPSVAAPTGSDAPSATAPADPAASICGLKAGDQTVPTTAPRTNWETLGKTAVPTAPKGAGPGLVSNTGVRTCYSHDPMGALYAAANVAGMGAEGRLSDIYKYLAAKGPGRDNALATNPTASASDLILQIGGYQFVSYTGDNAVINIGIAASNGAYVSEVAVMVWEDGDWKISVPSNGSSTGSQVSNLDQFIAWSGGGD